MADEPKPEERARVKIDEQLVDAGWHIADRSHFTYDHNATALTEGLLDGNHEATGSDMVTTVNYHRYAQQSSAELIAEGAIS